MHEQPDAANLLATASQTLRAEILPLLPPDQRIHILMVLRAIGIAERALSAGPPPAILLANGPEALRHLARDIRAGLHDHAPPTAALLLTLARHRCQLSNPKALSNPQVTTSA
jgi:hypothetical protein